MDNKKTKMRKRFINIKSHLIIVLFTKTLFYYLTANKLIRSCRRWPDFFFEFFTIVINLPIDPLKNQLTR